MLLSQLLTGVGEAVVHGDPHVEVRHLTRDSREVVAGSVFVAIAGARVDGHRYVPALSEAAAVVVEREVHAPPGVTVVRVPDSRAVLGPLAAALHGHPAGQVRVVGVTGTNGKTTVTTLIDEGLRAIGKASGRVGTTGTVIDGEDVPSSLTTPEAHQLQALLARMRDAGVGVAAMEVSSIGLVQHRVTGVPFHVGVFTNLGRDHLDFHGTMDRYLEAKAELFRDHLRPAGGMPRALVCDESPLDRLHLPTDRWRYGFQADSEVRVVRADVASAGMVLDVATPAGEGTLASALVGRHNALNLLAALGSLLLLDVPVDLALRGLAQVAGVRGRLEPVPNHRGLLVLVDYAHTDDALEAAIRAVRGVSDGEVWVVFGCGGDRDQGKRPRMGAVVDRLADHAVVTSDNPRTEDPLRIIDDVLQGVAGPAHVEPDRAAAIAWAIGRARRGDAVLVAGKGHETTQEIGGEYLPFDDRAAALRALEGS